MGVLAIWRYPVKAMLGELLDAVAIGPRGCEGDRRWIVVDARTGERIANKRGPTDPRLRACRAELLDDRDEHPPLRITLPDGSALEGAASFAEDELLGATLGATSGLELTVGLPTPRCVVPTRAQDGLPADPAILRTLVERHRIDLGPFGRHGCAGAYAEVASAGRVRTGERLEVRPGHTTPRAVIDDVVTRLRGRA
jgi:uncharacterized protein YcbX